MSERPSSDRPEVALVTGASRGIGARISSALAAQGYAVVATARSSGALREHCESIERQGGRAVARAVDVADVEAFGELVREVGATLGPIRVFVSNAGTNPILKAAVDVEPQEFDEIFDVNVRGAFFATTAVLRSMIEHGHGGSIIGLASVGAEVPVPQNSAYCMSKASLVQFARVMALEAAPHGVRVNVVSPGFVVTDLTAGLLAHAERRVSLERAIPLHRIGEPEDVVGAVNYLVSEAAKYVTGAVVTLDGGFSLRRGWPTWGELGRP